MARVQNSDTPDSLGNLGHPVHVFIDTSTLECMRFPFGLPRLQPFMDRLNAGDIRLVISEIIVREIREHVCAHVESAKTAHVRFQRDAFILWIVADETIRSLVTDVNWKTVEDEAMAAVDQFISASGVDVVPINGVDAEEVFDDYFARRAPFGKGKKKSEFPDSFAMKALLRYARDHKCKVAVVSEDSDWQASCVDHAELIYCSSIDQIVDYSQVAEAKLHEEVRQLVQPHAKEFEDAILECFQDRGFFWDSDEGHDSDVEDIYDLEMTSWRWSVTGVGGNWSGLAGKGCVHFGARVSYPDPDSCYRDPDTKELVFLGQCHVTLTATVEVEARVRVDVGALRLGELEFDELTVNEDRDIWFTEDEIEETHHDIYD